MRKWLIPISLLVLLVLSSTSLFFPVNAWKPDTHLSSGNDVLTDLLGHMANGINAVTIDGRDYIIPNEVAQAIRNFTDYYRGGVVGPDAFPDIYVGQELIHPDNRCTMGLDQHCNGPSFSGCTDFGLSCVDVGGPLGAFSYEWLRHVYDSGWNYYAAATNPDPSISNDARNQALAFTYGYLTHAAGDMWGHTLINQFAGGVFEDAKKSDPSPAINHIVVEAYIGKHTPQTNLLLHSPSDFIYRTFMDNSFVDSAGWTSSSLGRGRIFDYFFSLRDSLVAKSTQLQGDAANCAVLDPTCSATLDNALKAYVDAWILDINDGLRAWPGLSQAIASALFSYPPNLTTDCVGSGRWTAAATAVQNFVTGHLLSMLGAPDIIGNAIGGFIQTINDLISWFTNTDIYQFVSNFLGPLVEQLKNAVQDLGKWLIQMTFGIDLDAMIEFICHASKWINGGDFIVNGNTYHVGLSSDTSSKLDALMGLTVSGVTADCDDTHADECFDRDHFAAYKDTVVMAKLLLLGPDELNRLLADHGISALYSKSSVFDEGNAMLGFIRSLDGSQGWRLRSTQPNLQICGTALCEGRQFSNGMPLWVDCNARQRVFRVIFDDWRAPYSDPSAPANPKFPDAGASNEKHYPENVDVCIPISHLVWHHLWQVPVIDNAAFVADTGDFTGDGLSDVAIIGQNSPKAGQTSMNNTLQAISSSGLQLWSRSVLAQAPMIGLADLNGDGKSEIVVAGSTSNICGSSQGVTHSFSGTGAELWHYFDTTDLGRCSVTAGFPTFTDVNSDGRLDVVIANRGLLNTHTYALNGTTGTPLWQFTGSQVSQVLVGDITRSGIDSIILLSSVGHSVTALTKGGSLAWQFSTNNTTIDNKGALGDVNGDGINDVVVASTASPSSGSTLYAIENNGTILWSMKLAGPLSRPVPRDVDGDGVKDVIIGSNGKLLAIKSDGSRILWSVDLGFTPQPYEFDIDHIGKKQLIFFNGSFVYKVSNGGIPNLVAELPDHGVTLENTGSYTGKAMLVSADVNGDGFDELIVDELVNGQHYVAAVDTLLPPEPTLFLQPNSIPLATSGSSVTFNVSISGFPTFTSWDIYVRTGTSVLNPMTITLGGLLSSTFVLANCINGSGTGCTPEDGPGIAHSNVASAGGFASGNGTLFSITYTAVAGPSTTVSLFRDVLTNLSGTSIPHAAVPGLYGNISPTLALDFSHAPTAPVRNGTVIFTAIGGSWPDSYVWDFGDSSNGTGAAHTHTYSSVGTFNVTLAATSSTAITKTVSHIITVQPPPLSADFALSPSQQTVGKIARAVATTTGGTAPYFYSWDFGDSTTNTSSPVFHRYSSVGTFNVTLRVTDSSSNIQTVIASHTVQVVVPNFTISGTPIGPSFPLVPGASSIHVKSMNGFTGIVNLTLAPSPGLLASLSGASVNLTSSMNSATVTLTASFNATGIKLVYVVGTAASKQQQLVAVPLDVRDFSLSASPTRIITKAGMPATSVIIVSPLGGFTGTVSLSISASSGILCSAPTPSSITLTGIRSATASLSCVSGSAGVYNMTVKGTSGPAARITSITIVVQDLTIKATPTTLTMSTGSIGTSTISLTGLQGFSGTVSVFATSSPGLTVTIMPSNVNVIGNNVWDSGEAVIYDSNNNGVYEPSEFVISGSPTLGSALQTDLRIKFIDANNDNVWDPGETIVYDANNNNVYDSGESVIAGSTPILDAALKIDSHIKFIDASFATASLTAVAATAGSYSVKVTGVSGTLSHSVTLQLNVIDRPPVAAFIFSPANAVAGQTVTLDGSPSVDPDGTIVGYLWDFGDGTTGSGMTTTHAYIDPGSFTINLTVTDNAGLTGTAQSTIVVSQPAGAHASLYQWGVKVQYKKFSISKQGPVEPIQAFAVNDGNRTVWAYVQFVVTADTGVNQVLYTQIVQLSPGQSINGNEDPRFAASVSPTTPGNYFVRATIFFSASSTTPPIGDPSFIGNLMNQRTVNFIVRP